MIKKKYFIFLVFSPIIEILVSRIIEQSGNEIIDKKSVLILHPKEYKPSIIKDVKIICFDNNKNYNSKDKYNYSEYIKSKIQFMLYIFRRLFNVFGKRIYSRLGKLPVNIIKIYNYGKFIKKLNFNNKEVVIYTPNVKVHIFQIIIFYTRIFKYHILEEGAGSFKSINESEYIFESDLRLIIANLLSCIFFIIIVAIRLIYDLFIIRKFNPRLKKNLFFKYIQTPIFNQGMFFLNKIKPLSFNKVSEKAFSTFSNIDTYLYNEESSYEIIKKQEVENLFKDLKIRKIFILILPGDNINILKREFDNNKISRSDHSSIILRPHPRLSSYTIEKLTNLLDIKISKENKILSEKLRTIPIEILIKLNQVKLLFTGSQKSSLLLYCNK